MSQKDVGALSAKTVGQQRRQTKIDFFEYFGVWNDIFFNGKQPPFQFSPLAQSTARLFETKLEQVCILSDVFNWFPSSYFKAAASAIAVLGWRSRGSQLTGGLKPDCLTITPPNIISIHGGAGNFQEYFLATRASIN